MKKAPRRRDIWLVNLGRTAKPRHALVVSAAVGKPDRSLATLVPHTTNVRGTPFEAAVNVPFLRNGAFDVQSMVTVPHTTLVKVIGRLSAGQIEKVDEVVRDWLGLASPEPLPPRASAAPVTSRKPGR